MGYQMSMVPISENSAMASRYALTEVGRRLGRIDGAEPVVARRDGKARRHALHVELERSGQCLVEVVEIEQQGPFG